jgi:hypothetical protein
MEKQTIITPEDAEGYNAYLRAMQGPQAKRVLAALFTWPIWKIERIVAALERFVNGK